MSIITAAIYWPNVPALMLDGEDCETVGGMVHLCGVVARIRSYGPRGPGFDSRCYQMF
jgi:hypothetical protein